MRDARDVTDRDLRGTAGARLDTAPLRPLDLLGHQVEADEAGRAKRLRVELEAEAIAAASVEEVLAAQVDVRAVEQLSERAHLDRALRDPSQARVHHRELAIVESRHESASSRSDGTNASRSTISRAASLIVLAI